MDLRYAVTPIPGAVSIPFAEDFKIEVAFLDSSTGAALLDCTGPNAILMSTLLAAMPSEVLAQLVNETAVKMVMIAKGIS